MQGLLDKFGLSINEEKIQIREFPFEFEDQFAIDLSKFNLNKITDTNLRIYFSLIWKFAEKTPTPYRKESEKNRTNISIWITSF